MSLSPIATEERELPLLWSDAGFGTERLDWYTSLAGKILPFNNRATVAEFIAAMMLESGLDNLTIGNNAKHGSNNPWLGIGWCQLDTGYHATTLEFVHALRDDPSESLRYIVGNADLCYQGASNIWFNKQRWHAWEPEKVDPAAGFNPFEKCLESWDRVWA